MRKTHAVNILGRMVPRKKVRTWKNEKVANGKSETIFTSCTVSNEVMVDVLLVV